MRDHPNDNPDDRDDAEEDMATDRGYDGTLVPIQLQQVDHTGGPAVVLGAVQHEGHIIRAEGYGVLVIESPGARNGHTRIYP
jgi:hypothetical protein